jgi:uncharacterized membrane protein
LSIYVLAFLLGAVAGLRSLTAPAAVSWAARLGWLHLENTWLAFMGAPLTPYIVSLLAVIELISDKLPQTPSRKTPVPFAFRLVMGALCGWALGAWGGLVAGVLGAIAGTLAGFEARTRAAKAIGGKDFPVALIEDVVAIGAAFWIVSRF